MADDSTALDGGSEVVLVTGGSTGIGARTVEQALKGGRRAVTTGRSAEKLDALAERLGRPSGLLTAPGDAADPDAVQAAVDLAVGRFGRLDAVVANAGFSTGDAISDGDPERLRTMLLTNVLGPTLLIRAALPALRAAPRGRIVVVGSVAGQRNTPDNFYSVTKWAAHALAENTRLLVAPDGIGVTTIAPGKVDTPFWDSYGHGPTGPLLTDDDVARAITWTLDQPPNITIGTLVIRPTGQVG